MFYTSVLYIAAQETARLDNRVVCCFKEISRINVFLYWQLELFCRFL